LEVLLVDDYKSELGDCKEVLKQLPDDSVNLIFTSPPYADARKYATYVGIHPNEYADWWLERTPEFQRVLAPTGTLILNIKERVVNGQRSRYVHHIIDGMVEDQGWFWTENWIWHKRNCVPGKWPNRFRDSWEHLHQFNLQPGFDMHQDAVRVPIGDWAKHRLTHLSEKDRERQASGTGSGFGKDVSQWLKSDTVYPSNVLHLSTETGNRKHSAAFPEALAEFFCLLFTESGDTVLDPFQGSGTTGVVAARMGCHYVGIDTDVGFTADAKTRIAAGLAAASDPVTERQAALARFAKNHTSFRS
jgi:DNA modification methylase